MTSRPNLVFVLADDLGYADLGCYGARAESPVSPCLDALAAAGLRFTHGYANSPVCSPTRFALMTGRWQYRLRGAAEEPMTARARGDKVLGLDPAHPTLPSLLRGAGYATALFGKWHLGYPPHFSPQLSGYQHHFGPLSGGVDYFSHLDASGRHDLYEQGEEVMRHGCLTDLISDAAVNFVAQQDDNQPFDTSARTGLLIDGSRIGIRSFDTSEGVDKMSTSTSASTNGRFIARDCSC